MTHNVAGGWIHLDVNMDDLSTIERDLGKMKDKSTMVLRSAINEAAKDLNKRLLKEEKQDYAFREKSALNAIHRGNITKARTSRMWATITIKSQIGELYQFNTSPLRVAVPKGQPYNPPAWYKARVKRSNRQTRLALFDTGVMHPNSRRGGDRYKAFVVRYKSGHLAVAQRQPGTHMESDPRKEAIKTLFAPSVAVMGAQMYRKYEEANAEQLLAGHIQKQIQRYLS